MQVQLEQIFSKKKVFIVQSTHILDIESKMMQEYWCENMFREFADYVYNILSMIVANG